STNDLPSASFVKFALIAGMKPSVAQDLGGLLWAIPIAGKNVWPANNDFFAFGEPHLDAWNCRPDVTWHRIFRVVHRENAGRLSQTVHLKHRDTEHPEIILRFGRQRSRAADQGFQIFANHF